MGKKKYCQLKLGPNTINKDDVETIAGHFMDTIRLARTNSLRVPHDDLIVGVIYGEPHELSSHYKRISNQYHHPVIIGKEFWHRLTGDEDFYFDILSAIASVATESDYSSGLEKVIKDLGETDRIKALSPERQLSGDTD
ncbi:PmeII family type II restriction endonuclease [Vibrio cholerae]|uniref:PmeII family type II restriction endonuclease n=1 Tax=Vibrio cholerae TaxID=666 RepID=UPI00301D95D6